MGQKLILAIPKVKLVESDAEIQWYFAEMDVGQNGRPRGPQMLV